MIFNFKILDKDTKIKSLLKFYLNGSWDFFPREILVLYIFILKCIFKKSWNIHVLYFFLDLVHCTCIWYHNILHVFCVCSIWIQRMAVYLPILVNLKSLCFWCYKSFHWLNYSQSGAICTMIGLVGCAFPDSEFCIALIGEIIPHSFSAKSVSVL